MDLKNGIRPYARRDWSARLYPCHGFSRGARRCISDYSAWGGDVNLGSGTGTSVLEAVQTFEQASGRQIPYEVKARRNGDLATVIADPHRAGEKLGWQTFRTFADACRDAWNWQVQNPDGYSASR